MPEFKYDPSKEAVQQVDAALAATEPKNRFRHYWLEIVIVIAILLTVAAAFAPSVLPLGVVAVRPITTGSIIDDDDVKAIAIPGASSFATTNAVRHSIARRDVQTGEPLRRDTVARPWATALRTIQRGELITPALIDFRTGPFIDDGFPDLSAVGKTSTTVIMKGTFIRKTMIDMRTTEMIALRDVPPFRLLTNDDVRNAPSRTCLAESVSAGAVVRKSDLVAIDPEFDTLMSLKLMNTPARTIPGSTATLILISKVPNGQSVCLHHVKVLLLRVTPSGDGANVITALAACEHTKIIGASEIRAVQDVH